ncbi:MAG TPA: insulinase family protein, partial [Polyangiaceae bacterium]|nr:insulinase family protein [Polyangiaceae bacterium]
RHTPIGSHEDLTAANLDDVKAFFQQYYVPANASVTVVGDFQSSDAKRLIQSYFGPIPAGTRAPRPVAEVPPAHVVHWQKTDDVPLPRIYLAWHTPALYAPGDAELDLWSNVLTDGKNSRLYFPLVYDSKVAKDVDAAQASQQMSSYYIVQATAAPGQSVDALYASLVASINKALETPPTAAELERAVSSYKKSFYTRIEAVQSRASTIAGYFQHTGKGDYLQQDLARYVNATPELVHAAARRYLNVNEAVRLDILPGKKDDAQPAPASAPAASAPAASAPAAATQKAVASKPAPAVAPQAGGSH